MFRGFAAKAIKECRSTERRSLYKLITINIILKILVRQAEPLFRQFFPAEVPHLA
jgi:hypothetical protein